MLRLLDQDVAQVECLAGLDGEFLADLTADRIARCRRVDESVRRARDQDGQRDASVGADDMLAVQLGMAGHIQVDLVSRPEFVFFIGGGLESLQGFQRALLELRIIGSLSSRGNVIRGDGLLLGSRRRGGSRLLRGGDRGGKRRCQLAILHLGQNCTSSPVVPTEG